VLKNLDAVFTSGNVIMGSNVKMFEKEIANYLGVKYAISVANGSDALRLSVQALDITKGDYVITTPYTFFCNSKCCSFKSSNSYFCRYRRRFLQYRLRSSRKSSTNTSNEKNDKRYNPCTSFWQDC
jgi:Predicted pyridoxal phosphate-dependent enzyme apparently involved in regulation of cell wall biogenesis